jgi:hypothetical protein
MVHKAWLFYNYPWFIHVLAPLSLSLVLHTTDWEKSGTLTDILVEIVVLCGGTDMEGGAADGDGEMGAIVVLFFLRSLRRDAAAAWAQHWDMRMLRSGGGKAADL